jgi:hypothetical protein
MIDKIGQTDFQILEKIGWVRDKGKILEMLVKSRANGFIQHDRVEAFLLSFVHFRS